MTVQLLVCMWITALLPVFRSSHSRAYKYFQEHIYLRNQCGTLCQTNFGLVLRNSTSFRAEREKVNFTSTVGSWISVTSGPWRRPLVSSRSVLGGWRLSQMTLRAELDSLLQVTPSGRLCFHHWLGGSKGRLGYIHPLWGSMTASGHLRFPTTKDTFGSGTAAPLSCNFNYQGPHLFKN